MPIKRSQRPALLFFVFLLSLCLFSRLAQAEKNARTLSNVWVADEGNGKYKNPVLYADYSDPDVIRVGEMFYLVASSFDQVPGLPILESRDLVNWRLVAHALPALSPLQTYRTTRHGSGAWAPSIRYHAGMFFIFYSDPDFGIYMTKATKITGPWSPPKLIRAAKGWIDPCPLWDDDGKAYLIHGMAASRSGIKNILVIDRMTPDAEQLLDDGSLVVDGHPSDTTLEGPKLYKHHGYYYIFAPAGGVTAGYQLVLRSRSIYGPYERKVVLAQGNTAFNGPHQGAWVTTAEHEDWFLHFQDRGPYGRVVLLEPMHWQKDDWPIIGVNQDHHGIGEPVAEFQKPHVTGFQPRETPADSDEFDGSQIGPQWQWQANPQPGWALPSPALGVLRLLNVAIDSTIGERLWTTPNLLSQKLPGPVFTLTTRLTAHNFQIGDRSGLVLLGQDYAYLAIRKTEAGLVVVYGTCMDAEQDGVEKETVIGKLESDTVYLHIDMDAEARATFSFSTDGQSFQPAGSGFKAREGVWIGAKLGLFAQSRIMNRENGYVDVDWFRFAKPADRGNGS
ncbi:glycoside hydrolase 43 family protein [Silvibacterium dinghuense]|uniref:glycoside hydrolase family 43 protein n=1 Tax=Silvibacterium dinghuense TaxID=1560006 RepID=UPI00199552FB|nr:glycoside hydrolase 43 family protein [Silvibacterium dinghuense]GGH17333.1 glycoside hydrolase [Silvibacterium dinghuense]